MYSGQRFEILQCLTVGSRCDTSFHGLKNDLFDDCCLFLLKVCQEPSLLGTLNADFEPVAGQLSHRPFVESVDVFLCILLCSDFFPFLLKTIPQESGDMEASRYGFMNTLLYDCCLEKEKLCRFFVLFF